MFLVTIKNGDKSITIHRNDSSPIKLTEAQIKNEANAISAFDFAMLPNNPGYNAVHPLTTQVLVRRMDNNRILFDGRVISPKNEMAESGVLTRSYSCEGALGYLHDVTPGYTTYSGKSDEVIRKLIAFFNGQVEAYKQIKLGDLVKGVKQVKLETTPDKDLYDTLRELCVTTMGYDMRLRSTDQGRFLDVKSELGERGKTVIQLGRNLKSLSIEDDPTSIATRVIPLGKTLEDQSTDAEAPEKRLTLPETYLDIPELKKLYGVQTKTWTFDSADTVTKLRSAAQAKIKAQQSVRRKFTLSALDLSLIGKAPEDFTLFNSYRVVNPVLGLDSYLKVTGQTIDLVSPETADLTIGDKFKSGTDYAAEASKQSNSLSAMQQRVKNLQMQSGQITQATKDAQAAAKTAIETANRLQEQLDNTDFDGVAKSLADIKNQLTELFNNLGDIGHEVLGNQTAINDATANIARLTAQLKSYQETNDQLSHDMATIKTQAETNQTAVANLMTSVTDIQADFSGIKTQVDYNHETTVSLINKILILATESEKIKQRLTKLETPNEEGGGASE